MATVYKYQDYTYRDEAGEFTAEDVKSQLRQYFPELANATAESKTLENGDTQVTFVKRAGTKGDGESAFLRVGERHWINISGVAEITPDAENAQCLFADRIHLCGDEAASLLEWLEDNDHDLRPSFAWYTGAAHDAR
ncbi:MAG: hypothetical protein JXA21_11410 [Anaerolineae bacterium]|nr:hypothetical protein [Anaerolineae bacterium]